MCRVVPGEWFFIEGEVCQLNCELQHMYRGVVYTSLRLRSRTYNNSLVERLLFRAWLNFSHSKQASSQQHRRLWTSKRGHLVSRKRVKYTPVHGRGYAPAKIFGGGAKLVSIHYRENVLLSGSYRRTQLIAIN